MSKQNDALKVKNPTEETVKRYDEIVEEYSSDWRGKIDTAQLIQPRKFEVLISPPPCRILDAGCGTGRHSIYFAKRGYNVYGVDRSLGMIGKAIKNSAGQKINFAIGDIRALNFPDNSFDGVWTVAAIAHLTPEDKRKFIQEAHRVLKRNGILYIGAHNLFSVKHLRRLLLFYLSYLVRPNDCLTVKVKTIMDWAKMGYLFLDSRHWFYPKKSSLLKILQETEFSVLESNSRFSKRLSIYVRKTK